MEGWLPLTPVTCIAPLYLYVREACHMNNRENVMYLELILRHSQKPVLLRLFFCLWLKGKIVACLRSLIIFDHQRVSIRQINHKGTSLPPLPLPLYLHPHTYVTSLPSPQDNGAIVFSSQTSTTSIAGDLTLTDGGLLVFPPPSVHASLVLAGGGGADAEPPWGQGEGDLDGGGGWGAASRSTLTVDGTFVWGGGAISGNARVRERFGEASGR